jgi:hypothetical protein
MTSGVSKEREELRAAGEIRLTIKCAAFPETHVKTLSLQPQMGVKTAEMLGTLLCGTSPFYLRKPGPLSPIGKCATCGGQLSFEIKERDGLNNSKF